MAPYHALLIVLIRRARIHSLLTPARCGALVLAAALACAARPGPPAGQPASAPAAASALHAGARAAPRAHDRVAAWEVVQRADAAAAAHTPWPGFDLRDIPVAIYDGTRTWLFRHPAPSPAFAPVRGREHVFVTRGQHAAVRANSFVEIDGVLTATLLLAGEARARPVDELAARLGHEAFHVFQQRRHPGWQANEAELFAYPVDEAEALALRRLESEALRRALSAASRDMLVCWAAAALHLRQQRFQILPEASAAYERATELGEGLAQYVEATLRGAPDGPRLPVDGYAPERVRERSYATGHALATLLDRIAPGWKHELASGAVIALDALLAAALPRGARRCELPAGSEGRARARAAADIAALEARQRGLADGFLSRAGFRITILASPGAPLWPQGFDPLNVVRIDASRVLHQRWLKLGNAAGTIEILEQSALTAAAGAHPLMEGVGVVTITGLEARPRVEQRGREVRITARGVRARLEGAAVEHEEDVLVIRLGPSR